MNQKAAIVAAFVVGILMMTNKKTRGIRNNNPLNIRKSSDVWEGAIGDDGEFVQFEAPEKGIRAAARILKTYRDKHGLISVAQIITRWAPPVENDTTSYIDHVSSFVGLGRNDTLNEFDYPLLIAAMIKHESGQQPYSVKVIESGFIQGFAS